MHAQCGLSLSNLADLADELGLNTRAVRVELDELRKVRLPAIVHLDANHFVILEKITATAYEIIDPQCGRVRLGSRRFSQRFTGVAMEVSPAQNFRPRMGSSRPSWLSIFGSIDGIRSSLTWLFILALVLEATVLVTPLFVQSVVDTVIANHDEALLVAIAAAYFTLLLIQVGVSATRSWALTVVSASLLLGWSSNVFRKLLRLPSSYFESRSLGDISSRFGSLADVQRTVSVSAMEAALDSCVAVLTLAVLFFYQSSLAWLVVAGVLVYVAIRMAALRIIMEGNTDVISALAKQETAFIETVRSAALVRRSNDQGWSSARYMDRVNDAQRKSLDLQAIQLLFGSLGTLVFGAVKIMVIYVGAKEAMTGGFSAGMLVAFIFYVDQFTGRSSRLVDFLVGLKVVRVHIERVSDITVTSEESFLEGDYKGSLDSHGLSLRDVSFRYAQNESWVLANQSISIEPGECVAVCGPSGVGKSTFVKLISGEIDPLAGAISLGGIDIKSLGKRRFREIVAAVAQDDVLVSGTIAQNIAGFPVEPDEAFVIECAKRSEVHDEIMAMPMRYETLIGDLGVLLSGGQKQRVCLARALYRRPKILILDEATSHLDPATERRVFANLAEINCTRLIVAHRLETLSVASRVISLRAGQLMPMEGLGARGVVV